MNDFKETIKQITELANSNPEVKKQLSLNLAMPMPTDETLIMKMHLDEARKKYQMCQSQAKGHMADEKFKQMLISAKDDFMTILEQYQDLLGIKRRNEKFSTSNTVNQPKTLKYTSKWNKMSSDSINPLPRENEPVLIAGHFENTPDVTEFFTATYKGGENWDINCNVPNALFDITHWQTINKNLPKD